MITGSHTIPRQRLRGFTLMEMMIAMALLGMALTIVFSALRFASRSWERSGELGAEIDQLRVATSVVRRQLKQVVAIRPGEAKRELLFSGTPNSLEFVAPAPVQGGRLAALYRYRLRFVNEAQGKVLWLDYRPWLPGKDTGWQWQGEELQTSLLAGGLQDGGFAYHTDSPTLGESPWRGMWENSEHLPSMVRMAVRLQDRSEPWPDLVVVLPVTGRGQ